MLTAQKQLFDEVMKLPLKLRARLAGDLIESLDGKTASDEEAEVDAIDAEADRRWENFKTGKTKGIPAEKIFPSLRAKKKSSS